MSIRVGINGFGRIGRAILRLALQNPEIRVVHVNDLTEAPILAHLLKYDSVQGRLAETVETTSNGFRVGPHDILCTQEREPKNIPWQQNDCQIVLECTGKFRDLEQCQPHLGATVKKVILSAPGKDVDGTFVMGVNHEDYQPEKHQIISNASCTTNCLAPMAMILDQKLGIEYGYMTTIHSYTNDQRVVDSPHHDLRRARAAALNQVPTSTGAARAIALVLPKLAGKLEGMSIRVPTPNVSLVDLVVSVKKSTDAKTVNAFFQHAAQSLQPKIMEYCELPLVSSDYNGSTFSAVIDSLSTKVVGDRLVKVLAWYDNENGFSQRMLDLAHWVGKSLR